MTGTSMSEEATVSLRQNGVGTGFIVSFRQKCVGLKNQQSSVRIVTGIR